MKNVLSMVPSGDLTSAWRVDECLRGVEKRLESMMGDDDVAEGGTNERTFVFLPLLFSKYLFHVEAQVPERGGQSRQETGAVGAGDADDRRRRVGAVVDGNHGRGRGGISRLGDRAEFAPARRRRASGEGERRGPRCHQRSASKGSSHGGAGGLRRQPRAARDSRRGAGGGGPAQKHEVSMGKGKEKEKEKTPGKKKKSEQEAEN